MMDTKITDAFNAYKDLISNYIPIYEIESFYYTSITNSVFLTA